MSTAGKPVSKSPVSRLTFLPSRVSALAHTGKAGRTRRNVMIEVLTASVAGFIARRFMLYRGRAVLNYRLIYYTASPAANAQSHAPRLRLGR